MLEMERGWGSDSVLQVAGTRVTRRTLHAARRCCLSSANRDGEGGDVRRRGSLYSCCTEWSRLSVYQDDTIVQVGRNEGRTGLGLPATSELVSCSVLDWK